jgi:hypothetical protein
MGILAAIKLQFQLISWAKLHCKQSQCVPNFFLSVLQYSVTQNSLACVFTKQLEPKASLASHVAFRLRQSLKPALTFKSIQLLKFHKVLMKINVLTKHFSFLSYCMSKSTKNHIYIYIYIYIYWTYPAAVPPDFYLKVSV